jgi:hypothetical protein
MQYFHTSRWAALWSRYDYRTIYQLFQIKAMRLMSTSDVNLFISFAAYRSCTRSPPSSLGTPAPQPNLLPLWDWPIERRSPFQLPSRCQGKRKRRVAELLLVYVPPEKSIRLCHTMIQHVRAAAGALVGNLWKIQFQDWSSFLCASKHYSSMASYGIFFFVLERSCSSSLEHPSPSLEGVVVVLKGGVGRIVVGRMQLKMRPSKVVLR